MVDLRREEFDDIDVNGYTVYEKMTSTVAERKLISLLQERKDY